METISWKSRLTRTGKRTAFVHALCVPVTCHTAHVTLGGILTLPTISNMPVIATTLICPHSINAGCKAVASVSARWAFVDILARLPVAWKPSLTRTVMRSVGVGTCGVSVAVTLACGALVNIWGQRTMNTLSKTDFSILFHLVPNDSTMLQPLQGYTAWVQKDVIQCPREAQWPRQMLSTITRRQMFNSVPLDILSGWREDDHRTINPHGYEIQKKLKEEKRKAHRMKSTCKTSIILQYC